MSGWVQGENGRWVTVSTIGDDMSQFDNTEPIQARIVKIASECFSEKGIRRTTLSTIAQRSGVTVDELKSLFKSKSLLVLAVQAEALQDVTQAYLADMPDATLGEAIKYIIRTRCEFVEKNPERTLLFFQNAFKAKQPWSQMLDQMIWKLSVEFAALIEKSIREGEIRRDVDINTVVRAVVSFYLTGMVVMGLRANRFDAEVVYKFIEPQVDTFLDGMRV